MIDLRFGDCFDILPHLPDASVDLILADLPYGTTQNTWDSVLPLNSLWAMYRRVAKPNAAVVLTAQTPFDKVLGSSNLKALRYEWVWEKTEATGHLNAKKMPMKAHENVLVFYWGLPTYNPQMTSGHARKTAVRGKAKASENYGAQRPGSAYDSTDRYPRSVLTFSTDKQKSKLHPTQKPVALLEYLIRTYTNPGDVVLDNCMGSGSTGVACANLDRWFIGIENNETYFTIARERLGL